jgi:hypothetical protein
MISFSLETRRDPFSGYETAFIGLVILNLTHISKTTKHRSKINNGED